MRAGGRGGSRERDRRLNELTARRYRATDFIGCTIEQRWMAALLAGMVTADELRMVPEDEWMQDRARDHLRTRAERIKLIRAQRPRATFRGVIRPRQPADATRRSAGGARQRRVTSHNRRRDQTHGHSRGSTRAGPRDSEPQPAEPAGRRRSHDRRCWTRGGWWGS
jgi:hypothetical protein